MVHQHFMLVDDFSPCWRTSCSAPKAARCWPTAWRKARAELERLERDYGLDVDPDAIVDDLPVGLQQRVEILKALYRGAEILILDEPTGVLTPQEADHLFRILAASARAGQDHHPDHPQAARDHGDHRPCHRDAPGRGGRHGARPRDTSREQLAELMVGRKVLLRVDKAPAQPGAVVLDVRGLDVVDAPRRGAGRRTSASTVRAGEIVGIAGVAGNGQSELLEALAGIAADRSGSITLNGKPIACAARRRTRASCAAARARPCAGGPPARWAWSTAFERSESADPRLPRRSGL